MKALLSRESAVLFVSMGVGLAPGQAQARENGVQTADCAGCHTGGQVAEVEAHFEPEAVESGEQVALVVKVTSPGMSAAGIAIWGPDNGTFTIPNGEPLVASGVWVTQSSPKPATGGEVEFRVDWRAPEAAGIGQFQVAVLAANGDGRSSGDRPGLLNLTLGYGCEPLTLYWDGDDDGFGRADSPLVSCGEQTGYSTLDGDCDDRVASTFPGAPELCNEVDDDCDEAIDNACGAAPPPLPTSSSSAGPVPTGSVAPPSASSSAPATATIPITEPSAAPSASVTAPSVTASSSLPPPSVTTASSALPPPGATTTPSASASASGEPVSEAPADAGFGCTFAQGRSAPGAVSLLGLVFGLLGARRKRRSNYPLA